MIGELNVSQAVPGTNKGVTEHAYPFCNTCGSEHTSGISVDRNGLIWFDDSLQSIFGSFPDSGGGSSSFTIYKTPTPNSHPHDGLNVDGQNRVWFDEESANKLAEAIDPSTPSSNLLSGPVNTTWYFAEGKVGQGFTEYLTIQNPDPVNSCTVSIQYLLSTSTPAPKSLTVAPNTRWTEGSTTT